VAGALERAALPACLLDLELTETVVMQSLEDVARKIACLRDTGVTISIDDFGTGYSSLSYLQTLRIDYLKIDRSFIRNIPFDANALSLTRALVSLAHGLGTKVVVEGVETSLQLETVRSLGCDIAQGYFLGYPAPASYHVKFELEKTA
jgi:EAL domain-containing protein (putative c-di-GMP-specific phosphodiesterase class I)